MLEEIEEEDNDFIDCEDDFVDWRDQYSEEDYD